MADRIPTQADIHAWFQATYTPNFPSPAMRLCNERRAHVLWLRYCVEPPQTLREVGAVIGRGQERARQIAEGGLRVLRHPATRRANNDYEAVRGTRIWSAITGHWLW